MIRYFNFKKADTAISVTVNVAIILGTIYVATGFALGDYKHPLFFLDAMLPPTPGVLKSPFSVFSSIPTFDKDGLLVVFTWPLYKLSGIAIFLYTALAAQMVAFKLESLLEKYRQS